MDNATLARSLTTLATYDRIIEVYEKRALGEQHRPWFETVVRQRDLKQKEETA